MAAAVSARRSLRTVEHNFLVFRRTWRGYTFLSLAFPILFLVSMGLGLGGYVDRSGNAQLGGVPYIAFIGPGLLAAQAMMTAAAESTYPIMAKLVWLKTYQGALNTPLGALDLLAGELGWTGLRLTFVCTVFLAVMAGFGAVQSPLAILALPAAVLTGLAFAAPILAYTATQRRDSGFNALFRFGITPLFLFSGTFFPLVQLPLVLQALAWLLPLAHGVALARDMALGRPDGLADPIHLAVLLAYVAAGAGLAARTYRRRLEV